MLYTAEHAQMNPSLLPSAENRGQMIPESDCLVQLFTNKIIDL